VKRKRYSWKFQRMAVERMRTSENVGEMARELGSDRGASTSGAQNSKRLKQRRKLHVRARTRQPTEKKTNS